MTRRQSRGWQVRWVPVWYRAPVAQKVLVGHVPEPDVNVWRLPNKNGLFYRSRFRVDADGAPNAYHPLDRPGLDALSNAGYYALVRDRAGKPVKQTERDPYPGFYISKTTLEDDTKDERDTSRYVDSRYVPYYVLPGKRYQEWGVQLGDYGVAVNMINGKMAYAVFADEGPTKQIGEGSMALARALGLNEDPRSGGTESKDIFYLAFPGSGQGQGTLPTREEIDRRGSELFGSWGGLQQIQAL